MSQYQEFFLESKRLNSLKPLALVRSDRFEDFIRAVVNDESLDLAYKAFIICSISGGLRVTEALKLTKESFELHDGQLCYKVNVLKKRRPDTRWCRVHPIGQATVEKYVSEKIGPLFSWTSNTAFVRAKRYFKVPGICNHSFRHSAISYYLFEKNKTNQFTAKLVHINSKIVDLYAHLDERHALKTLF
jgi:integrase